MNELSRSSEVNKKYKNGLYVDKYAALWSYGYINGFGESEGLYQTISGLAYSSLEQSKKHEILDIGCGVGRTTCDLGTHFYNSYVTAIDPSEHMIAVAKDIVLNENQTKCCDLTSIGLGVVDIPTFGLKNVSFENVNLNQFCDVNQNKQRRFNLIVSVNMLDRCVDILDTIKQISNLSMAGGHFIAATPLNFQHEQQWVSYGSASKLLNIVEAFGFKIIVSFDNLIYREVVDGRGSYEEYRMLVFKAVKR